jgi:hypothetical protein
VDQFEPSIPTPHFTAKEKTVDYTHESVTVRACSKEQVNAVKQVDDTKSVP